MGNRLVAAMITLATGCTFVTADPLSSRWQPPAPPVCNVGGGALAIDGAVAFISLVTPLGGAADAESRGEEVNDGAALAAGAVLAAPWIASMIWGVVKRRQCNAAKQNFANAVGPPR